MATFNLTAVNPFFVSKDCQIQKGSEFKIDVHTPGVNSSNLFLTPERRRVILNQFACQGVDLAAARKEYMLNGGYWKIEQRPANILQYGR